jgi:hypothetical protein
METPPMTTFDDTDAIPPLEDLHRIARAAYVARDLNAYMDCFSPDLRYCQPNGRTIGRDQLARDVKSQFQRVSAVDSTYRTDGVIAGHDGVVETVTQWGWIAATAFYFVHRLWRLERHGDYTWRRTENGWKIFEVIVLQEFVVGNGFQFGLTPRLPTLASIEPLSARN